jgi:AAA domain, putative AbiEii toxin, Type IV TA system/AAA ATPase domain
LYVKSLKVENLRCFKQAELEMQYPGKRQADVPHLPNINLFLGNNGMGKTTILRALALAALSPIMPQSGYLPYRLVRRADPKVSLAKTATIIADVLLHEQDVPKGKLDKKIGEKVVREEQMSTTVIRSGDYESLISGNVPASNIPDENGIWAEMYNDKSPAFLVVGYGASRRVEDSKNFDESSRRKARVLRYERVAGLFESHVALTPLAVWLPKFQTENPGRYKQTIHLINRLLPDGASFDGEFMEGDYIFEVNGTRTPFAALSDGYRAYIGWIADLLYHVCTGAPKGAKLVDNYGLVLVDEIDLHLHPEWQRSVAETVSKALPNIQFVFSTHSPIVAGSLNKENIFVMESDSIGASIVRQYDERIYGLSAEKVLLSSYFNLRTTSAAPFVDELRDLSVKAGKGDLKAALAFMEKVSGEPITKSNGNESTLVHSRPAKARSYSAATSLTAASKKRAVPLSVGLKVSRAAAAGKAGRKGSSVQLRAKAGAGVKGIAKSRTNKARSSKK